MTTLHIGMSVRGAIRNGEWRRSLVGSCTDPETGRVLTADEILSALFDCLLAPGSQPVPFATSRAFHDGNEPTYEQLLALSAVDHDCQQDDIEALVWLIRRLDKRTTEDGFLRAVREAGFNRSATALALREFESFRSVVWQDKRRSAG